MMSKMKMAHEDDDNWLTKHFRDSVIVRIDEANQKAGFSPSLKHSAEMENRLFQKSKTRNEYIGFLDRLLYRIQAVHERRIKRKKMMERKNSENQKKLLQQPTGSLECKIHGNPKGSLRQPTIPLKLLKNHENSKGLLERPTAPFECKIHKSPKGLHQQPTVPLPTTAGFSYGIFTNTTSRHVPVPTPEDLMRDKKCQLSIYIEPLRRLIGRTRDENVVLKNKLKTLLDILSNPNQLLPLPVLDKLERVIEMLTLKQQVKAIYDRSGGRCAY